ncbi:hypothetical protein GCM10011581_33800 [Saccharopolyspora subtropica]|uniref:Uncharacterized protein n=1 Tax=Saccharopolyspora thermophila TaxID=89367 RepID=A0A917NFV3_9PSEU|nr:hypothetical protein [Saccharopolyspora subtropica]GGI93913.1 hypothetical protein GCM10011581_33800 [Saccharopolyspora subtropica]
MAEAAGGGGNAGGGGGAPAGSGGGGGQSGGGGGSAPAESKPAESKSADPKPESKSAESKPAESTPADSKPAESAPAESKPDESKTAESKPSGDQPPGSEGQRTSEEQPAGQGKGADNTQEKGTGTQQPGSHEFDDRVTAEAPLPDSDPASMRAAADNLRASGTRDAPEAADEADRAARDLGENFGGEPGKQLTTQVAKQAEQTRAVGQDSGRLADDVDRAADIVEKTTQERKADLDHGRSIYAMADTLPPGEDIVAKERTVADAVRRGHDVMDQARREMRDTVGGWADGARNAANAAPPAAPGAGQATPAAGTAPPAASAAAGAQGTVRQAGQKLDEAQTSLAQAGDWDDFMDPRTENPVYREFRRLVNETGERVREAGRWLLTVEPEGPDADITPKGPGPGGGVASIEAEALADHGKWHAFGGAVNGEYSAGAYGSGQLNMPDSEDPLLEADVQLGAKANLDEINVVDAGPLSVSIKPEARVGPGAGLELNVQEENGQLSLKGEGSASPIVGGGLGLDVKVDLNELNQSLESIRRSIFG